MVQMRHRELEYHNTTSDSQQYFHASFCKIKFIWAGSHENFIMKVFSVFSLYNAISSYLIIFHTVLNATGLCLNLFYICSNSNHFLLNLYRQQTSICCGDMGFFVYVFLWFEFGFVGVFLFVWVFFWLFCLKKPNKNPRNKGS